MESQLKYIELKSGYADNGPAWIGKVEFSKSGKTIYFNGHALKGNGHGVCSDIENGEIYWISGVKKNGQDRHWAGNGKIMIDRKVIDEYLAFVKLDNIDLHKFIVVDIEKTDKTKFVNIENENVDSINVSGKYNDINRLSVVELESVLLELKRDESYTNPNNGKKFITIRRLEVEKRLNELRN